jgi:hypothetical protein
MEYLIGLLLCLAVAGLAIFVGFDRERAFYPTVLIVVGSYYVLFALMGASTRALLIEIAVAIGFLLVAIIGYKKNLWLIAIALVGHGVFDGLHHLLFENPGVPRWWPGFLPDVRCRFGGIVGNAFNAARVACWLIVPAHREIPFRLGFINPKAT